MKRHVLVVEDSQVIQRLIEMCLRPAGFEVTFAEEGAMGVGLVRETNPDLVVLDVGLPDMTGWEVLAQLRGDESTRESVVLMLTADGRPETELMADDLGADAFLTKPFRPNDLREIATSLVGPSIAAPSS